MKNINKLLEETEETTNVLYKCYDFEKFFDLFMALNE